MAEEVKTERQKEYAEYLESDDWKEKQKKALKRAGYCCQVCNSEMQLNVHHRTYERVREEQDGDLTVLCHECHALFHGKSAETTADAIAEGEAHFKDITNAYVEGASDTMSTCFVYFMREPYVAIELIAGMMYEVTKEIREEGEIRQFDLSQTPFRKC